MTFQGDSDEPRTNIEQQQQQQQQQQHQATNNDPETISKPPEPVKEKAKENSSGNKQSRLKFKHHCNVTVLVDV